MLQVLQNVLIVDLLIFEVSDIDEIQKGWFVKIVTKVGVFL